MDVPLILALLSELDRTRLPIDGLSDKRINAKTALVVNAVQGKSGKLFRVQRRFDSLASAIAENPNLTPG